MNAATGEPLKKVAVTLRRADSRPGPSGAGRYSATTGASGRFSMGNIEPGQYRLSASRTGFVDAEYGSRDFLQAGTPFSLEARRRMGDVLFRMTPSGVLTGRILDEDLEKISAPGSTKSTRGERLNPAPTWTRNFLSPWKTAGSP